MIQKRLLWQPVESKTQFAVNERLSLILAFVGLLLLWLLTLFFFSFDRSRALALGVSGFILLILLGLLAVYFRRTLQPVRELNRTAVNVWKSLPVAHSTHKQLNETEFITHTFETVLAQMQEQQRELTVLQNKLNDRAASAEAFSQHVVNSLPSGLIAFDAGGTVQIANQPAREIFPLLQKKDFQKLHLNEIFEKNEKIIALILESLKNGKVNARIELDYQTHNQNKRLGLTVAPLAIENEICGALCLAADITEIALLREQSEKQRNLESLGVMSAGLAHEFKNSLATLHSYARFLGRTTQIESGVKAASALGKEIGNLSEMINSFLNFARPQTLTLSKVDLEILISDCLEEVSQVATQAQVILERKGSFPIILADETLLRQTILNLLRNAVEATSDSTLKKVQVKGYINHTETLQSWVNIEVRDTGQGIREKDFAFLFVPFFTTKQHGHGIGLALSHRIITQHGGMLIAGNNQEGGAAFTIKLPKSRSNNI